MHYLLFYEKAPDYAERQLPLLPAHRQHLCAAVQRGEILLAGSLEDPIDGSALLLFQADSPAVVEAFAAADPFVTGGSKSKQVMAILEARSTMPTCLRTTIASISCDCVG